ncbi:MAG: hypothetical protein ACUVSF_08660 [Anaerolineae bacterium]
MNGRLSSGLWALSLVVSMLVVLPGATGYTAEVAPYERGSGNLSDHPLWDMRQAASGIHVPQIQPPMVTILAPSAAMGDFGANRKNVWDMADLRDIVMADNADELSLLTIDGNTILRGNMRDGPPHVGWIAFWGSSSELFPAAQHHHMIFRMKIQARSDCWTNGRVGYAKAWSGNKDVVIKSSITTYPYVPHISPMNCPYGSFCIYYIDLARNNNWPYWPTWRTAGSVNDPSTWLSDPVRGVALVPHEWCVKTGGVPNGNPEYFDLDFVYLTGDIVARAEDGYRYLMRCDISAPGAQAVTVTIRYQELHELRPPGQEPPCNAQLFNSTWRDFNPPARTVIQLAPSEPPQPVGDNRIFLPVIARAPGGSGNLNYPLDFSDATRFKDGKSYYLCVQADNGAYQVYQVSSAPVIRVPRSPLFGPN